MPFLEIAETSELESTARRYDPIAAIGRGGMAELLLALAHAGQGARRLVVLKRIWPELASDLDFREMFLDEARLALRLNHPNVVQTYDVLDADGQLSIAMEYLDGQPLVRLWGRMVRDGGELSVPLRLRIAIGVLSGLQYAHTLVDLDGTPLGLVHRDVSPENIFVTYDGHVKLVDFGVAKTLAAAHQTRAGAIRGKLAYMAPEQFSGRTVDWRADLFAVGILLWEMLSGRRIWQGLTDGQIVAHLSAGRRMPWLPAEADWLPGLRELCARALEPDPEQRFQSAAEMEAALESMLIGLTESHPRSLGRVVARAFEAERLERQALIERSLRADEPVLEIIPERAAPAIPEADRTIELTRTDLEALEVSRPAGRLGARWVPAAATVTAVTAGLALLLGVGWWRQPATATTPLTAAPGPALASNLAPAATTPPLVVPIAGTCADKAPRPRATRARAIDADAPLPPTLGGTVQQRRSKLHHVFRPVFDDDAPLSPTTTDDIAP
ncbi:MAG TPA: serine/threonine-protein kinase [Polyangia bacterium]|nr:serine/threonine-protein kinase [Polyangia bacterium]